MSAGKKIDEGGISVGTKIFGGKKSAGRKIDEVEMLLRSKLMERQCPPQRKSMKGSPQLEGKSMNERMLSKRTR